MMEAACTGTGTGADMTSALIGCGGAAGCSTGAGWTIALGGAAMLSAALVATATGKDAGMGSVDKLPAVATPTGAACTMPTGARGAIDVGSSGGGGAATTCTVVAWAAAAAAVAWCTWATRVSASTSRRASCSRSSAFSTRKPLISMLRSLLSTTERSCCKSTVWHVET